jgi:putative modified peptide
MANSPVQLSTAVAANLLRKLGSDDVFRTLFQQNPVAALKQAGASDTEAEGCGRCLVVSKLADKVIINENIGRLTELLTVGMDFQPHKLGVR